MIRFVLGNAQISTEKESYHLSRPFTNYLSLMIRCIHDIGAKTVRHTSVTEKNLVNINQVRYKMCTDESKDTVSGAGLETDRVQ